MAQAETSEFKQLKAKLREIFQLDRADLDFGIYRIMNSKNAEISDFLEHKLLPQVKEALAGYAPADLAEKRAELREAEANPRKFSPEYITDLKQQISNSLDSEAIEQEIYSDLYNFFRRYYSEGDFMSLRRYKQGVYALPYEGEEVKLYWANADQYYIKTSENLKHYSFKTNGGKKRVRFELIAAGTELNNNKAAQGKERRFILAKAEPIKRDGDELIIPFEYRPEAAKQAELNERAARHILKLPEAAEFGLDKPAQTKENRDRTVLEKHLTDWTARNTFDYFIHKDLGGFLRRELDFYIKNEIMHLDDIDSPDAPQAESYLAKIRAIRRVAGKIIQFLAQLEDFQKKLWLKKKFVLEAHYCITLDHIIKSETDADALLPIIAANEAQREEWVKLFAIDEISGDLAGGAAYSAPLTIDFLKANDKLPVDTKFFDPDFKYRLLDIFNDLDEQTNGLLIESENFQALNLLQERYREQVKCIYIDPPYNTGNDGFLYKDGYPHSTWLTCIGNRLKAGEPLLRDDGFKFISIGNNEVSSLTQLLQQDFGESNFIVSMTRIAKSGGNKGDLYKPKKDYVLYGCKNREQVNKVEYGSDLLTDYNWKEEIFNGVKRKFFRGEVPYRDKLDSRPNQRYYIEAPDGSLLIPKGTVFPSTKEDAAAVLPQSNADKCWTWSLNRYLEEKQNGRFMFIETTRSPFLNENGQQAKWSIYKKVFEGDVENRRSIFSDIISGCENSLGTKEIANFGLDFNYPKPSKLVSSLIGNSADADSLILDYFAGSGTTAHAVINLNREDKGARKYILVEMGEYFNSVTKPRVLKAAYAKDWKNGKPADRSSGISQIVKYMALEQYEDSLDNLTPKQSSATQQLALDSRPEFYEKYMLRYMLETESRGAQSLLNIDAFADPFAYSLTITRNDERRIVHVDLIETFNYLLGLRLRSIHRDKSGIITIEGINSLDETCLIIWRKLHEIDNSKLSSWFEKRYSTKDFEFDAIYINGDNNLPNMRQSPKPAGADSPSDEIENKVWKIRLIEAEFQRLMFDTQNI